MKPLRDKISRFYWRHIATDWQRANHYLRRTNRFYSRQIAEAEKNGKSYEEVNALYAEWGSEREPEQEEIDRLLTAYWLRRAARHHIPEPSRNDPQYWKCDEGGRLEASYLSDAGIDFIDRKLYEKRKRRWEAWIAATAALTGLVGAATGFAAVWLHH
jgi:hypothetical protein